MKLIIALLGLSILTSCSECERAKRRIEQEESDSLLNPTNGTLNAEWFNTVLDDTERQLIDLRSREEFLAGTIKDARNIDFSSPDFERKIGELDMSMRTFIFSESLGESISASFVMAEMGFQTIYRLEGGYSKWPFK